MLKEGRPASSKALPRSCFSLPKDATIQTLPSRVASPWWKETADRPCLNIFSMLQQEILQ